MRSRIKATYDKTCAAACSACNACVRHAPHLGALLAAILFFMSAWLYFGIYQPSAFFPVRTIITIPEGSTITDAATILADEQAVRSAVAFRLAVMLNGKGTLVQAGDYYFDSRLNLAEVVYRVTHGEYGLEPIRITIPEGATTYQMATIFGNKLPKFDAVTFLMLARDKEGYLFPDTYLFLPNVTTSQVLDAMERTFYERLRPLEDKIAAFGRPIDEIVTMASLLEKEASDPEERREIAGVLWHRIDIGMPLQVDAVFGYIKSTDTFSPKFSDLEVDSPYNTYKHVGLPPGPIGSPSLSSLEAAVTPVDTDALFYLHGKDGVLHLAKTFDQHLINRRRYLD
jgi:UPF0755 protein